MVQVRTVNRWRSPVSIGDASSLFVIGVLLLMPALALDIVGWNIDLVIVVPILLISVGFGFVLAKSRLLS